ncbi:hypothetical protein CC78DRAFT_250026 [Lojkania enalia]|uniref:Uncharacterized protein n=1 Tax=Lojkania enalia TaxID=147567 RepID=A0A9P4KCY9_9PLEO|nr:hypothetical protein CC78DRAFT_250026 [Didymosphaeria enalia]
MSPALLHHSYHILNTFEHALIAPLAMNDSNTPTYAESNPSDPSEPTPPPSISLPVADEPPAYTLLDNNQTTFTIHGTFIHSPTHPCYQISCPLDQRTPSFRIRRLPAREVSQVGLTPIPFDKQGALYEVTDPPFLDHEYHMRGFRRSCLPGLLSLKFRLRRWHVFHTSRAGAEGKEIMSLKVGTWGTHKFARKKDELSQEWRDASGKVMATEMLKIMPEDKGVVPVLELSENLDQTWRELLISLWAGKLWVEFGGEKTTAMGDGLSGRFVSLSTKRWFLGNAAFGAAVVAT